MVACLCISAAGRKYCASSSYFSGSMDPHRAASSEGFYVERKSIIAPTSNADDVVPIVWRDAPSLPVRDDVLTYAQGRGHSLEAAKLFDDRLMVHATLICQSGIFGQVGNAAPTSDFLRASI